MNKTKLTTYFGKVRLIASISAALFILTVLMGFGIMVFAQQYVNPTTMTVNYKNNDCSGTFTYSDDFFAGDSKEFNPDLAVASLGFTTAGFGQGLKKNNQSNIVNAFMEGTLFTQCEYTGYDELSSDFSVATAMGHRAVKLNGKDTDIIIIVIRSGQYKQEWYGNIDVSNGGMNIHEYNHFGFDFAASRVALRLMNYLEKHSINRDNLKVLLTGFSRGGAIANVCAAKLIDYSYERGHVFSGIDVCAYTFATPRTTEYLGCHGKYYGAIHNVISPYDIVPEFPFKKWGFERYGTDYYLPSSRTVSDFNDLERRIKASYNEQANKKLSASYDLILTNQDQAIKEIIDCLDDVAYSRYAYDGYRFMYSSFKDAIEYALGRFWFKDRGYDVFDSARLVTLVSGLGLDAIYIKPIKKFLSSKSSMISGTLDILKQVSSGKTKDILKVSLLSLLLDGADLANNATHIIFVNHSTHFYMAALRNSSMLFTQKGSVAYRRVGGFCPIDMNVYDSRNTLVASVVNNEIVCCDLDVEVIDDNKFIYIPNDDDYRIEINATDDGEMTYSVSEFSADGTELRRVDATDISITDQQKFYGDILKLDSVVSDSDLGSSDVSSSDVSGSDVSGSDVSSSDVSGSDVSGTDVSSSDVSSSDVSGSDVSGTDVGSSDIVVDLPDPNSYALTTGSDTVLPDTVLEADDFGGIPITLTSGEGGQACGPEAVSMNDYVTVRAVPHFGYTFAGWYDSSDVLQENIPQEYTFWAEAPIELKAKFTPIPAEALEIVEPTDNIIAVGGELTLTPSMTPVENCELAEMTFTSSNDAIATVTSDGDVVAVAPGAVEINASTSKLADTVKLYVGTPSPMNLAFGGVSGSDVGVSASLRSVSDESCIINQSFRHDGKSGYSGSLIVPPGTFDLNINRPGCLSYINKSFVAGTDTLPELITLYAGDVNADNVINAKDQAAMTEVFGAASTVEGYTVRADFNEDGFINAKDRSDIITNFGKSGTVID